MAQEEARRLNHNYIGTEHILLGLLDVEDGIACRALDELNVSLDRARARVEEIIGRGSSAPWGHIPFTRRAKSILELSLREAIQLGHRHIGTEHILLGVVREGKGVACQVLDESGVKLSQVRRTVIQLLEDGEAPESVTRPSRPVPSGRIGMPRLATCSICGRDLWDMTHYVVGPRAAICADCVETSHSVVEEATRRDEVSGPLRLPPGYQVTRPMNTLLRASWTRSSECSAPRIVAPTSAVVRSKTSKRFFRP